MSHITGTPLHKLYGLSSMEELGAVTKGIQNLHFGTIYAGERLIRFSSSIGPGGLQTSPGCTTEKDVWVKSPWWITEKQLKQIEAVVGCAEGTGLPEMAGRALAVPYTWQGGKKVPESKDGKPGAPKVPERLNTLDVRVEAIAKRDLRVIWGLPRSQFTERWGKWPGWSEVYQYFIVDMCAYVGFEIDPKTGRRLPPRNTLPCESSDFPLGSIHIYNVQGRQP